MHYRKSENDTVNQYLEAMDTPLKPLFLEIRETVLSAVPGLKEDIKWKNCLVYALKKNMIQTVLGKQHISLIFFKGMQLPDPLGLLEGDGAKTKTAKITPDAFNAAGLKALVKEAVKFAK